MFRYIRMSFLAAACLLLSGCQAAVPFGYLAVAGTETEAVRELEQANDTETKETENEASSVKQTMQIPEVRVTYGEPGHEIPSVSGGYTLVKEAKQESLYHRAEEQTQTVIADSSDPLEKLAESENAIPYVRLGMEIRVQFKNGTEPDYVRIEDMVLNKDGNALYGSDAVKKDEAEPENESVSVTLSPNLYALRSTDSVTYQKGGVLRGFRMICEWENGSRAEYAWILKTDAVYGAEGKSAGAYLTPGCGTGEWIMASVTEVKDGADGPVAALTVTNQLSQPFTYGEAVTLKRFDGTRMEEVPLKENTAWKDVAYTLGGEKSVRLSVNIGQLFGKLTPGYYVISRIFTNESSGDTRTVSAGFQIVR